MESAFVFRVTFENGTQATGSLLNPDIPELDISYRMLYQLSTGNKKFGSFADRLDKFSQNRLRIEDAIDILAKLEKVDDVKKMTVILCVDAFQMLKNDGTQDCDFYRVMRSVCGFLNSSTAFAVCVCSATIEKPFSEALTGSPHKRLYLVPPALRGEDILVAQTPVKKLLVGGMGGHGRALEILDMVLQNQTVDEKEIDPGYIVDKVNRQLHIQYAKLFDSDVFTPVTCKEVLAAIISRRQYKVVWSRIGKTNLTVDKLRSFGLFRWTSEGRLECAFVFLVELMRNLKLSGELVNFNEHITRAVTTWQPFERFVGFYRQVKSIVFQNTPILLSEFHVGARFGAVDCVVVTEQEPRQLVEATTQLKTKSDPGPLCSTDDGNVKLSETKTIIINGTSASIGDLLMGVELDIWGQPVHCNEVIQCKLLETEERFKEDAYGEERTKVANDLDVFLLMTSSSADKFDLPPRCGIVSIEEFPQYFGPFASRAFRSLLAPLDLNVASYHELRLVEGFGDVTAKTIVNERNKRKFSSVDDAVDRVCSSKKCKTADVIRLMYMYTRTSAAVETFMQVQ